MSVVSGPEAGGQGKSDWFEVAGIGQSGCLVAKWIVGLSLGGVGMDCRCDLR